MGVYWRKYPCPPLDALQAYTMHKKGQCRPYMRRSASLKGCRERAVLLVYYMERLAKTRNWQENKKKCRIHKKLRHGTK